MLNYSFTVRQPAWDPIMTMDDERNKTIEEYTKAEFKLYEAGADQAEDFAKISKFWEKLQNPDGTLNSAYGKLLFHDQSCGNTQFEGVMRTPFRWAMQALIADKDSRQAIMKFHKRQHLWVGCKDQVCTIYGIYHIRLDELIFTIRMRSNDVILGLVYDLPYFCLLQHYMLEALKPHYPGLKLGCYHHSADSMHLYEKNVDLAKRIIGDRQSHLFPTD
jgi:thymidylate synthase